MTARGVPSDVGFMRHAPAGRSGEARDWDGLSVDRPTEKQSTTARRAVSVLAQIGTPEAIGLLKKWAEGKDVLGQAAAEALKR